jgi:hypothetical protein
MDCTEATSAKQKCPEKILRVEIVQVQGRPATRKPPQRFGEQGDEPSSCKLGLAMSGVTEEGRKKWIAYPEGLPESPLRHRRSPDYPSLDSQRTKER